MPEKCICYNSYGFICDFLEFPLVNSFKFFTLYQTRQGTNFLVCTGSFFRFYKFVFAAAEELVREISLKKKPPTKVKC